VWQADSPATLPRTLNRNPLQKVSFDSHDHLSADLGFDAFSRNFGSG